MDAHLGLQELQDDPFLPGAISASFFFFSRQSRGLDFIKEYALLVGPTGSHGNY